MNIGKLSKIVEDTMVGAFDITKSRLSSITKLASETEVSEVMGKLGSKFDVEDLGETLRYTRKEYIPSGDHIIKDAVLSRSPANLGAVPDAVSDIGIELNTSSQLSSVTLPDSMLESMEKLGEVRNVFTAILRENDWTTVAKTPDFTEKRLGNGFKRAVFNVIDGAGDFAEDLVNIPTLNKYTQDKLKKQFGKMYEAVAGDLSVDERKMFNHGLNLSADADKPIIPLKNGFKVGDTVIDASQREVDALLAAQEILEYGYQMKNLTAVRTEIGNGTRLFDGKLLRPVKQTLGTKAGTKVFTKELMEQGHELFEIEAVKGGTPKKIILSQEEMIGITDLPRTMEILPKRQGYGGQRIYTEPWRITKIRFDPKTNRISAAPHAVAHSRNSAEKAVAALFESSEDPSVFVAHRAAVDELDLTSDVGFVRFLDELDLDRTQELVDQLKSVGYTDASVDKIKKFGRFFSHHHDSTQMRRGQRMYDADSIISGNPEYAASMPADEAIGVHLNGVASYSAHAEWFNRLEKAFLEEFGGFNTRLNDWRSQLDFSRGMIRGRTAREAFFVQAQMKRVEGILSSFDKSMDSFVANSVDRFAETKVGALIDEALGNMASKYKIDLPQLKFSSAVSGSKSFTAKAKLGMFNLSQPFVQGTAMLNVIGYSGHHAMAAIGDLAATVIPEVLKIGRTAKGGKLWKMLNDSGFVAGLDYVNLQNVGADKAKLFGSRFLRKVADLHMLPYTIGEGGVRALAWFAEHRKMLSAIKKGKSVFTMDDVGSPAYLRAISDAASVPALNMSRMNQPLISRGALGVPFQFQQYVVQELSFIFGEMSAIQRAGVFGAWAAPFGIAGIPLIQDAMWFAESAYVNATDDVRAIGFFERNINHLIDLGVDIFTDVDSEAGQAAKKFLHAYVKRGILPTLTDGELTLAHRVGMAKYIHEQMQFSSVDDALFGPAYSTIKSLVFNNVETVHDLVQIARSDDAFTANMFAGLMSKSTKGISSLANVSAAIEALVRDGDIRDIDGRLVTQDATISEIMLLGLGFGIGERNELFETRAEVKRRSELLNDTMWNCAKTFAKLSVDRPEYAMEYLNEKIIQAAQYNPQTAKGLLSSAGRALIATKAPENIREVLFGILKFSKAFTVGETEMYLSGFKEKLEKK